MDTLFCSIWCQPSREKILQYTNSNLGIMLQEITYMCLRNSLWTNSCSDKPSLIGYKCDWQVLRPDHWTSTHFPPRIHKNSNFNNYNELKLSNTRTQMYLHSAHNLSLFLVLVINWSSGFTLSSDYIFFLIVFHSGEATTFEIKFSILTSPCPSLCNQCKVFRQFPPRHWALGVSDCMWAMTRSCIVR